MALGLLKPSKCPRRSRLRTGERSEQRLPRCLRGAPRAGGSKRWTRRAALSGPTGGVRRSARFGPATAIAATAPLRVSRGTPIWKGAISFGLVTIPVNFERGRLYRRDRVAHRHSVCRSYCTLALQRYIRCSLGHHSGTTSPPSLRTGSRVSLRFFVKTAEKSPSGDSF
jgi:hypothetical protein